MWNKIKAFFGFKPNPYIGMFRGWEHDKYKAWSPDRTKCVWISNGFFAFGDYDSYSFSKAKPFLHVLTKRQKRLLYKALIHDLRQDVVEELEFYKTESTR